MVRSFLYPHENLLTRKITKTNKKYADKNAHKLMLAEHPTVLPQDEVWLIKIASLPPHMTSRFSLGSVYQGLTSLAACGGGLSKLRMAMKVWGALATCQMDSFQEVGS